MQSRIVPPAILCVIATYPVWALAGWLVLVAIQYTGPGFLDLAVLATSLLIPGFLVVGLSIALLIDRAHHRIWGVVVALFYGLASLWSILIFYGLVLGEISSFPIWIALGAAAAPPIGLVGAIWSITWKPIGEERKPDNRMWIVSPH